MPQETVEPQSTGLENPTRFLWSLSRGLTTCLDEQEQYQRILGQMLKASHALAGALIIYEPQAKRYVFRSAHGLDCPESAICNLVWSQFRQSRALMNGMDRIVIFTALRMRTSEELAFERLLGFRSLCVVPLKIQNRTLGAVLLGNRRRVVNFTSNDIKQLHVTARTASSELERIRLCGELRNVFMNLVRAFVSAIEFKDPYTHGHSERVTDYSVKIAKCLGWADERIEDLHMSAILHDIGKIAIPEVILQKPAKLTEDEYKQIQRHPEIGARIIGQIPQLSNTLAGIHYHHERIDGGGYPQRLGGQDIPDLGRLIAVADAYDAMTSDRPYRKALSAEEAVNELRSLKGHQFDGEMVDAFLEAGRRGYIKL
jgi:hypothetical protein